jgi:hypothetical protein
LHVQDRHMQLTSLYLKTCLYIVAGHVFKRGDGVVAWHVLAWHHLLPRQEVYGLEDTLLN